MFRDDIIVVHNDRNAFNFQRSSGDFQTECGLQADCITSPLVTVCLNVKNIYLETLLPSGNVQTDKARKRYHLTVGMWVIPSLYKH